jgi:hypothetical protein
MSEIIIRAYAPQDRENVQKAIAELQQEENRLKSTSLPGAEGWLEEMRRRMEKSGTVFIAEKTDVFLGFASYWIADNHCGQIADLYVVPPYRGQNIAGLLLAEVERHVLKLGISRLRISALAANEVARRAYEKAHFTPYELVYEKVLSAPREIGGAKGLEPTRYGDWEHKGRCTDF